MTGEEANWAGLDQDAEKETDWEIRERLFPSRGEIDGLLALADYYDEEAQQ